MKNKILFLLPFTFVITFCYGQNTNESKSDIGLFKENELFIIDS
jgi:hypothetical protein